MLTPLTALLLPNTVLSFMQKMTLAEARLILNLKRAPSAGDVHRSYAKVLKGNHPDRGGSPYLARKIGEAKDLLLKSTHR